MRNTLLILLILVISPAALLAQSAEFTYQGTLNSGGVPANGSFPMTFSLWPVELGGAAIGTIGPLNVNVTNGNFSVRLDFGAAAFPGAERYLEINVSGTTLSPRSKLSSTPYAVRALTVTGPVAGANAVATLTVTNSQPGITDPSPTNLPPAALRGEATSTSNANVGLMGIARGSDGAGVVGLSTGTGEDAIGIVAISTGLTGASTGLTAEIHSPEGIAIEAGGPSGSTLFSGNDTTGGEEVFSVSGIGAVRARSFTNLNGSFMVGNAGNLGVSGTINAGGNIVANNELNSNGHTRVFGSLFVTGSKNAVVKLQDGRSVLLYATESPDSWFEDFGTVRLRNGRAVVHIDRTFAETANVDMPYMVFLTPAGDCRGLYVTRKSSTRFEVRELRNGRSNISFDFRIVARRRGFEQARFAPAPPAPKPE